MNFATKLLMGSISVLLITSTVNMLYSFRVSQTELREDFAAESEEIASKISKVLAPVALNQKETCRVAAEIVQIQSLKHLSVSRSFKELCAFGHQPAVEFDLSLPEQSRRSIEQSRVYTTYASVPCQKKGCHPLELEIGISFARLDAALAMLWNNQLQNAIALIFGAAVFLFIFSAIVRRRLEKLTEACAKIQGGNLDLQLKVGGKDEISRVADAMNNMARDLRLAAEEKDRQRQALLQTSKMSALGEMAGGMAHEINNPLAIIKMSSAQLGEILQDDPLDREMANSLMATIEKTCDRISKIIIGLRAFSREGSGDPFAKVRVADLIEETIVLCRDRFAYHDINLQVEEFDQSLMLEGRSTQVSQVLLNLLNNAYDAVMQSDGGRWVKISVASLRDFVEIRVTDSNRGIPAEVQKKMFQPFFTTKEVGKGTGMGLSISVGIMKAHRGDISVDNSSPNTCFVIRLPKG